VTVAQDSPIVTRPDRLRSVSVPKAVASFLLAGLAVIAVVGVLLAFSQRRVATAEAIRDARTVTNLEATDVVGPLLTDAAFTPGPAHDALDAVVKQRVLGSRIVRVKVWDETGRIVYSDDADLIGARFPLPADELHALRTGQTSAEVSELDAAENRDERQFGKLLQVYLGVQTPSGTRLLFETYQPYTVITESSRRMWHNSLPVLISGLALLYLVQAPLAFRMARRLKATQDEREALLLASLAASDRERATIAADLHDGVVQGLAGASFSLSAAAERSADRETASAVASTAKDLRRWVRELRSLVVTITPPTLHAQGLEPSLRDLAATLEVRGIATTVEVDVGDDLDFETETLLYRGAQEAVRNVIRHADASVVSIRIRREGNELVLTVRDNGRGIGTAATESARSRGSVGIELLGALVTTHAGSLTVEPRETGGTEFRLAVPVGKGNGSR
jgi:signal transduction histidine kinase